ncbi:hypothetical protein RIR_jg15994.t1 [Rhizophagus irregularis DAOM 181602=DAOM 197198]|nr:hypothetical protein RIR_jg15994.t1 [Rhizophagus irregularis DAOM 181602=DAOM 197198]
MHVYSIFSMFQITRNFYHSSYPTITRELDTIFSFLYLCAINKTQTAPRKKIFTNVNGKFREFNSVNNGKSKSLLSGL